MNLQKQRFTAEFKREQAGVGIKKGEEMHLHKSNKQITFSLAVVYRSNNEVV